MTQGRKTTKNIKKVKIFIARLMDNRKSEILKSDGTISYTKIMNLVKEELGIQYEIHAISRYVKEVSSNLMTYRGEDSSDAHEEMKRIERLIKQAENEDNFTAVNNLLTQKRKWRKYLAEEQVKIKEVSRPKYTIVFGHFENVEKKCPKCGHVFLDASYLKNVKKFGLNKKEIKENNEKGKGFKAENGQATIF